MNTDQRCAPSGCAAELAAFRHLQFVQPSIFFLLIIDYAFSPPCSRQERERHALLIVSAPDSCCPIDRCRTSVCLSVCLSAYLPVYLSDCLFIGTTLFSTAMPLLTDLTDKCANLFAIFHDFFLFLASANYLRTNNENNILYCPFMSLLRL